MFSVKFQDFGKRFTYFIFVFRIGKFSQKVNFSTNFCCQIKAICHQNYVLAEKFQPALGLCDNLYHGGIPCTPMFILVI